VQTRGGDVGGHRLHELLAGRGLLGGAGLDLGLDVQRDLVRPVGVHEVEHLGQQRHPLAGREPLAEVGGGPQRAAVDRPHLRQRQVLHERAARHVRELGVAGECGRRVDALGGRQVAVVGHDGVPVLRDLDVELEGAHPELEGVGERRQRVLHDERDAAPVGLEIEAVAVTAGTIGGSGKGGRGEARDGDRAGDCRRDESDGCPCGGACRTRLTGA
jgi:hypothetical protein